MQKIPTIDKNIKLYHYYFKFADTIELEITI